VDKLNIGNVFYVKASPEVVFKYLTDLKWVAECLPSLSVLKIINENEFIASFKVDVSNATKKLHIEPLSQITANMKFKFLEKKIEKVVLEGTGRAAGSKLEIKLEFNIKRNNNITQIPWNAQIDLGVLLKFLGHDLINETTNSIANEVIKCISYKLNNISS